MHGPDILVPELFKSPSEKTQIILRIRYYEDLEEKPQAVHEVAADLEEEGILGNPHPYPALR